MSLISRSLPGLFGGVSQQIPAMRHPTHCSEQTNAVATLVDGLFKRPGTKRRFTLPLTGSAGMSIQGSGGALFCHLIDKGPQKYLLTLANETLILYNLQTGGIENVSFPQGFAYLTCGDPETAFRAVSVADYTFIVNTEKVPELTGAMAPTNPVNVGYVNIKSAVPGVTYRVFVDNIQVTHTTGTNPSAPPTSESIATALRNSINALGGYTATVLANTNIIKVVKLSGTPINVSASDSWNNQATAVLQNGVDAYAMLPPQFEPGYTITINGTAESNRDAYYVKWENGRWVETIKPGARTTIDKSTMPHQLRPAPGGGWVFEPVAWENRRVGDDETNPPPSFIGTPIRNVVFFRNRLGFLASDSVSLSRAGDYFNFFASTATTLLDTDPIDLSATSDNVETLEWAVTYNQTLLLWTQGKQQFVLTGGDVLSPSTARLLPSTTFEAYSGCSPVSIGNRILYPAPLDRNLQINLYRVSEDTVTNYSEDLTEWVPTYIPGNARELAASTVYKALVVVPRGVSRSIPLFKFETDDRDVMTQKAWSMIELGLQDDVRVLKAFWVSRTLWLILHVTSDQDAVPGGRLVVETMDFEEGAVDNGTVIPLRLDSRVQAVGGTFSGGRTRINIPYLYSGPVTVLKCEPGQAPQPLEVATRTYDTANLVTRLFVDGNHTGAIFWVGIPYTMRYVFTEPFLRDDDGSPIMEADLKLVRVVVRYEETGEFTAKVTPMLRQTYSYPFSGTTVGLPDQGVSMLGLSRGDFAIPVYTRANEVEVAIESYTHLPAKFPYAEWVGNVNMKARR